MYTNGRYRLRPFGNVLHKMTPYSRVYLKYLSTLVILFQCSELGLLVYKSNESFIAAPPSETIDNFVTKLSGLASKAMSLGYKIEEGDLVKRLLDSMPKSFLKIVASIEQCFVLDSMLFDEAVGRLKAYEERIKGTEKTEDVQGSLLLASGENSNVCKHCGNGGSNRDGFGRGRGRGRGSGKGRDVAMALRSEVVEFEVESVANGRSTVEVFDVRGVNETDQLVRKLETDSENTRTRLDISRADLELGLIEYLSEPSLKPSPDGPMGKTLASPRGGQGFESRRVSIRGGHGLVFGSGFIDSAYYNGQRPGHPGEPVLNGNTLF
ncbi:hypothetical protein LXL04_026863 [Taraxacum kok-saghyz]